MFKFFIPAALLICSLSIYPQAAVDIPLIITDSFDSLTLHFGLDLTATTGLDPHLGEIVLPSVPPGIFNAAFDLSPYIGSFVIIGRDYRYAPAFPINANVQHRLRWALGYMGSALTIIYNLPSYAAMQIMDEFGGVLINSPDLTGSGTFIITDPLNSVRLNITYTNAVPVELISFTGLQEGSNIKLNWTTATETNNKGFEVQRKAPNSDWEVLYFIEGHGTTTEVRQYSYTDNLPLFSSSGIISYRLRQIDYDGTSSYSEELEVEYKSTPADYELYQNYPNPFNPETVISYSIPEFSHVILKIMDMLGNEIEILVDELKPEGKYEIRWTAPHLSTGVYVCQFIAGSYSESRKMILMK